MKKYNFYNYKFCVIQYTMYVQVYLLFVFNVLLLCNSFHFRLTAHLWKKVESFSFHVKCLVADLWFLVENMRKMGIEIMKMIFLNVKKRLTTVLWTKVYKSKLSNIKFCPYEHVHKKISKIKIIINKDKKIRKKTP